MSDTIAMHIDGEKIDAKTVLEMASNMLAMLKGIEHNMTGKKATTPWTVDILSTHDRVTIKMTPIGDGDGRKVAFDSAKQLLVRLAELAAGIGEGEEAGGT